jgi:group I intron endonuclease
MDFNKSKFNDLNFLGQTRKFFTSALYQAKSPENNSKNVKFSVRLYESMLTCKKQIFHENKGKCGIYLITNTLNGKSYVGSSVDLKRRLSCYYSNTHMLCVLKRSMMLIYLSILKYGIKCFRLEIVEYCDVSVLYERETYYIEKLSPEYNILRVGGSLLGYRHTKASLIKIRSAKLGSKHSVKTRCLIREAALLRKRNKHFEETRAKIKAALTGRKLSQTTIAKLKDRLKHRV